MEVLLHSIRPHWHPKRNKPINGLLARITHGRLLNSNINPCLYVQIYKKKVLVRVCCVFEAYCLFDPTWVISSQLFFLRIMNCNTWVDVLLLFWSNITFIMQSHPLIPYSLIKHCYMRLRDPPYLKSILENDLKLVTTGLNRKVEYFHLTQSPQWLAPSSSSWWFDEPVHI